MEVPRNNRQYMYNQYNLALDVRTWLPCPGNSATHGLCRHPLQHSLFRQDMLQFLMRQAVSLRNRLQRIKIRSRLVLHK